MEVCGLEKNSEPNKLSAVKGVLQIYHRTPITLSDSQTKSIQQNQRESFSCSLSKPGVYITHNAS